MKNIKRSVSVIIVMAMIFCSVSMTSFANSGDEPGKYENINLKNINFSVANNSQLLVEVDEETVFYERVKAKRDINKLKQEISKDSSIEKIILKSVLDGETVGAISYTTIPVEFVDNHWEKCYYKINSNPLALVASAATTSSGDSLKGDFTLYTKVTKDGVTNSAGQHRYIITSYGRWSNTSVLGGENHQASGNDYAYILVPSSLTIANSYFSPLYWYKVGTTGSYSGRNGTEYWMNSAHDQYAGYKVVDDPFGINQLQTYTLTTDCYGSSTSSVRKAYSYYVHTWKSISVSFSLSVNAQLEPELVISPEDTEKSWSLCNPVSFTFY